MRVTALGLLMCTLLACGGDEEPAKGSYNALCDSKRPCGTGLTCIQAVSSGTGLCSSMCMSDGDCAVHGGSSVCVGAGVGVGHCYQKCMDSVECPYTHTCTMTATEAFSTCRPDVNN